MKFVLRAVILLIVPLLLIACNHSKPFSPSETIVKFDKAAKKGNIKGSKKYIDKETLRALESGKAWWIGTYNEFLADYNKTFNSVTPLKKTEKINGDTATVEVKITHEDKSTEKRTYNLVKENDQWKITMNH
jgi:hypothetical protein